MCHCTPEIKTPFCGRPGCQWPDQKPAPSKPDVMEAALNRLRRTLVEIDREPGVGRLTSYGAGCVIDSLRMGGFKIVRDDA